MQFCNVVRRGKSPVPDRNLVWFHISRLRGLAKYQWEKDFILFQHHGGKLRSHLLQCGLSSCSGSKMSRECERLLLCPQICGKGRNMKTDIVSKSEQWKNVLLGGQCRHSWCGFIQGEIMTKIHKNNFPLLEGCHHGRERRGTSYSFTVCYARASNCEDYHHHKGTSPVRKMSSFGQCPKENIFLTGDVP